MFSNMTGSFTRIRATLVCTLFMLIEATGGAFAQTNSFDPSVCPTETHGKVLVRLTSGLAFRFDPDGFLLRGSTSPPEGSNLPPEGCPGSPIVTAGITFPFQYNASLRATLAGRKSPHQPIQKLEVIAVDGALILQDGAIELHRAIISSAFL